MEKEHELDIIARIRGEVQSRKEHTGVNLFLVWGYPTVVVLLLEFAALMLWNEDWCRWLWVGIPLVGAPLMIYFVRKDYERTGRRTLDENIAMQMWLFIGAACCLGGFATGFAGVFRLCYCTFQGLLVSMGCFLMGVISRFRPMTVGGIVGAVLSFTCPFFQGDLWPWQLLVTALVAIAALVIPGHLSRRHMKKESQEKKLPLKYSPPKLGGVAKGRRGV